MRVLSSVLFASGALAAAVARPDWDCVLANTYDMAVDARCGDSLALARCFRQLTVSDVDSLTDCYRQAGCEDAEASAKAAGAHDRCVDLFADLSQPELRRRRPIADAVENQPPRTTSPPMALASDDILGRAASAILLARDATTGDACLTTGITQTRVCDLETADGTTKTGECSSSDIETSSCSPGKTCTMDSSGENVCMDLQNSLDIAGIIIAIVFGVLIALGIATLTFLCCRDRKEQKRLAAKAEATALARAATKKKRQQEQRAPLMQNRRDATGASVDPFHDRNRS